MSLIYRACITGAPGSGDWATIPRGIDTKLHYITLHYITLHYITLHYTTLHYTTLHYTTLHYTTLHYTTLHYITLHYTTLHCTTLHYITLHYITLHYITLHYTTLHYTTLHYTTLHYITLHYITLHYTTLHYTTLHYTTHKSYLELLKLPYLTGSEIGFLPQLSSFGKRGHIVAATLCPAMLLNWWFTLTHSFRAAMRAEVHRVNLEISVWCTVWLAGCRRLFPSGKLSGANVQLRMYVHVCILTLVPSLCLTPHNEGGKLHRGASTSYSPFTPKSDQRQISPAASPEI